MAEQKRGTLSSPLPPPAAPAAGLVSEARRQLVQGLGLALPTLAARLEAFFKQLADQPEIHSEMRRRSETWQRYHEKQSIWTQSCSHALNAALAAHHLPPPASNTPQSDSFELISDEAIENRIQASRLALAACELAGSSFEALRLRSQWLQRQELAANDLLRPETFCELLVEQWLASGLLRSDLQALTAPLQIAVGELLQEQYAQLHLLYDRQGVPLSKDLAIIRRNPEAAPLHYPATTASPPRTLVRARQRAQDMLLQLRNLLPQPDNAATGAEPTTSARLAQALADQRQQDARFYSREPAGWLGTGNIAELALSLRERANSWKRQTAAPSERAAIEVVALMFLSILAEERIPPSVRVWFARLQLPVLRVALAEAEFFSNLQHPARLLIDRMGGCVMGFAATSIGGSALETEISRLVQLIEQYPETGQRVFRLAYEEFEHFLARDLTQQQPKQQIVTLAQQIEQKETLTIQYTIELRRLLKGLPVRDELRSFLFRHWAEVLALSTLRNGPTDAQTLMFKQTASDLVWAGSAKPTREQRTQLIRSLPQLLQRLRDGLSLVGLDANAQAQLIKRITDTLAEAFVAKTQALAPEDLAVMAQRLSHLENFMAEESPTGDQPLSSENIARLLNMDITGLQVISDTSNPVDPTLLEWAHSLQTGSWFTLDHNGTSLQVQYAWRSKQRQLHLFATLDRQCYLIPLQRLASYLQSGLLLSHDAESLTLRATRDALAKIEANPERLG